MSRRPVRVGDIVRTRELCIDGRIVVGRVRERNPYYALIALDGVAVWCSLDEAQPAEPGAQLTLV